MSLFKFQPGDRFKVVDLNSLNFNMKGTVKSIVFNSVYQDWEYVVHWDNSAQEDSYECVAADRSWDHDFSMNDSFSLFNFNNGVNPQCNHDWKLYKGFLEDYEYCAICDLKKKKDNR